MEPWCALKRLLLKQNNLMHKLILPWYAYCISNNDLLVLVSTTDVLVLWPNFVQSTWKCTFSPGHRDPPNAETLKTHCSFSWQKTPNLLTMMCLLMWNWFLGDLYCVNHTHPLWGYRDEVLNDGSWDTSLNLSKYSTVLVGWVDPNPPKWSP